MVAPCIGAKAIDISTQAVVGTVEETNLKQMVLSN